MSEIGYSSAKSNKKLINQTSEVSKTSEVSYE